MCATTGVALIPLPSPLSNLTNASLDWRRPEEAQPLDDTADFKLVGSEPATSSFFSFFVDGLRPTLGGMMVGLMMEGPGVASKSSSELQPTTIALAPAESFAGTPRGGLVEGGVVEQLLALLEEENLVDEDLG